MATATAKKSKTKPKTGDPDAHLVIQAANLLKMAGDPTRLSVLLVLEGSEKHVGAICDDLGQGQPAVSHHLAICRHAGLITPRREGKNVYYSLTDTGRELAKVVKEMVG